MILNLHGWHLLTFIIIGVMNVIHGFVQSSRSICTGCLGKVIAAQRNYCMSTLPAFPLLLAKMVLLPHALIACHDLSDQRQHKSAEQAASEPWRQVSSQASHIALHEWFWQVCATPIWRLSLTLLLFCSRYTQCAS